MGSSIVLRSPRSLEILRSVNHTHQFDAVFESHIENDVRLGGETTNPLLRNFRSLTPHQRLLCQIADDIIEPTQITIRTWLTGIVGDVTPNLDEILASSRPANDARHGLRATLIARACFSDDRFHVERLSGTAIEAFADRGTQSGEF